LQRAFVEHDTHLDAYVRTANVFLRALAPENEDNVRIYSEALAALYAPA
jgi:hypothetical protein